MKRKNSHVPLLAITFALTLLAGAQPAAARHDVQALSARAGNNVVVRARPWVTTAKLRADLAARGFSLAGRIAHTHLFVVSTHGADPSAAVRSLARSPAVASARPDYVRHAFDTPNDPYFASSELYFGTIRAPQAWDLSHGSRGITIAVVDSGVTPVEDLADKLLPGRNFVADNADARDDTRISHGTLVAGVAAATTNNAVGIAGVGWDTTVLPIKVLNAQGGGTDAQIANGIVWAADHGAKVINLSLGGESPGATLCDTVGYALSKGALVVAAAGNDREDVPMYPAACPGVLAVSATDTNGDFAWFSEFGSWIGLAAPGIEVTSTLNDATYGTQSGTSMAAPMVSGVAALLWAEHPDWGPSQIASRLESTAQDRGPAGVDPYYGSGLLDAYAALSGVRAPSAVPPGDSFEPNDDASAAALLSRSTTASISPEGDVDWYVTRVPSAGRVTFDVAVPPYDASFGPNFEPVLQIYDEGLDLLANSVGRGYGRTGSVSVRIPGGGYYYLRVANDGGARSPGLYTVSVTSVHLRHVPRVLLPT